MTLADAQSTVRATVSRALAHALILGIDHAEQEGHPLTQLQQIDLATMHIMAYDEAQKACAELATFEHVVKNMQRGARADQPERGGPGSNG